MLSEGRVGQVEPAPLFPTLVYDADCAFCCRWVGRVRRWDREQSIRYLPLQDTTAQAVTGRTREQLKQAVHLVTADGPVYAGAAAARELLTCLPGGRMPRALMDLPGVMSVAAKIYAWVARRYGPVN
jgi:predicted DCC family thiol-disulfide oxidoreductase YuxK